MSARSITSGVVFDVLAVMRQNRKFRGDARLSSPIYTGLVALKAKIDSDGWETLTALEVVTPFVDVVTSVETSGPITLAGLDALFKIITGAVVAEDRDDADLAVAMIGRAVTNCRFEATNAAHDEVVLARLLDVVLATLRSPIGRLIGDGALCEMIQNCFRIGNATKSQFSELLRSRAENTLVDAMASIFSRLESFPAPPLDESEDEEREHEEIVYPEPEEDKKSKGKAAEGAGEGAGEGEGQGEGEGENKDKEAAAASSASSSPAVASHRRSESRLLPYLRSKSPVFARAQRSPSIGPMPQAELLRRSAAAAAAAVPSSLNASALRAKRRGGTSHARKLVTAADPVEPVADTPDADAPDADAPDADAPDAETPDAVTDADDADADADAAAPSAAQLAVPDAARAPRKSTDEQDASYEMLEEDEEPAEPFTTDALKQILEFLASLLDPDKAENSREHRRLGLRMTLVILERAGHVLSNFPNLLNVMRDGICKAVIKNCGTIDVPVVTLAIRAVVHMHEMLGGALKLQWQFFFREVLLRLAKSGETVDLQEVAMEHLVHLFLRPNFAVELFVNYDCDLQCFDLFEMTVKMLSKAAYPEANGQFGPLKSLALEALVSIVANVRDTCRSTTSAQLAASTVASELRDRKDMKKHLSVAADHFNAKPKTGIEYLRTVMNMAHGDAEDAQLDPDSVADFFHSTHTCSKEFMGVYMGGAAQFNQDVLRAFLRRLDFRHLNVDEALRMFIDHMRLPGEAQQISRVLETFAAHYYAANKAIYASPDMVFVLSFSVILLNTDLHNKTVKRKMTFDDFVRNNRELERDGLSRQIMRQLYDSIQSDEIKMAADAEPGKVKDSMWTALVRGANQVDAYVDAQAGHHADRSIFAAMWRPTISAITVVFGDTDDMETLDKTIAAIEDCADIAAFYSQTDIMNHLVTLISKNLAGIVSGDEKALVAMAASERTQKSAMALFRMASAHGAAIRDGWRSVIDVIVGAFCLDILPAHLAVMEDWRPVLLADGGAQAAGELDTARLVQIPKLKPVVEEAQPSAGLFGSIAGYLSFGGGAPADEPSPIEVEQARKCLADVVAKCAIEDVLAEARFLPADSLLALLRALVHASDRARGLLGPRGTSDAAAAAAAQSPAPAAASAAPAGTAAPVAADVVQSPAAVQGAQHGHGKATPQHRRAGGSGEDVAVVVVEHLVTILVANKDRAGDLWPIVHAHLSSLLLAASAPTLLFERTVLAVLRICMRFVHKDELNHQVIQSLGLLLKVRPDLLSAAMPLVMGGVFHIVRADSSSIRLNNWQLLFHLIEKATQAAPAVQTAFETLSFIIAEQSYFSPTNFFPCARVVLHFGLSSHVDAAMAMKACDLLLALHDQVMQCLALWGETMETLDAASATPFAGLHLPGIGGDAAAALAKPPPASPAHALQTRARQLDLTRASKATEPETLPEAVHADRAWILFVQPLLQALAVMCRDHRDSVRNYAVICVQRALLARNETALSPTIVKECFFHVVFPLLNDVLSPLQPPPGASAAAPAAAAGNAPPAAARARREPLDGKHAGNMEETRLRSAALLSKLFLQNLTELLRLHDFHMLWLSVLEYMNRFIACGHSDFLAEATVESLKNILLVLSDTDVLQLASEEQVSKHFWELTWSVIDTFLPRLHAEFTAQMTPKQNELPSDGAADGAETTDGAAGDAADAPPAATADAETEASASSAPPSPAVAAKPASADGGDAAAADDDDDAVPEVQ